MITVRKICQLILIAAFVCVCHMPSSQAGDAWKISGKYKSEQEYFAALNKTIAKVQQEQSSYENEIKKAYNSNSSIKKEIDDGLKRFNAQAARKVSLDEYISGLAVNQSISPEVITDITTGHLKQRKSMNYGSSSFNAYAQSLYDNDFGKSDTNKATDQASDAGAGTNTPPSESAVTGCSSNYGLFSGLINTGSKIFNGLRDLIYVVAGFGIIGVAVGGFFGNLNWKWLGAIVISLVVIATTGELINLITGCDNFTSAAITDTLK